MVSFFSALGPIEGHKVQHLFINDLGGQIEKIFKNFSPWTDSWCKKPLGLISTVAPIGMLDLG